MSVMRFISSRAKSYNKRFKRDNQRVAFLLCVGFYDYGVMRKVGSSVGCPLTGRYAINRQEANFDQILIREKTVFNAIT